MAEALQHMRLETYLQSVSDDDAQQTRQLVTDMQRDFPQPEYHNMVSSERINSSKLRMIASWRLILASIHLHSGVRTATWLIYCCCSSWKGVCWDSKRCHTHRRWYGNNTATWHQQTSRGQDYKEKHKTRLKTNVKRTVLNNTKLRHFWAQIVSWAPIHARKTFIILAPGQRTFRHLAEILLQRLVNRAKSNTSDEVHFVTGTYRNMSIKNAEWLNIAASGSQVMRIHGQALPQQWMKFLSNGHNKESLIELIFETWSKTAKSELKGFRVYLSHGSKCHVISPGFAPDETIRVDEVDKLNSIQEEADTRMFLHATYAANSSAATYIIIVSLDTDAHGDALPRLRPGLHRHDRIVVLWPRRASELPTRMLFPGVQPARSLAARSSHRHYWGAVFNLLTLHWPVWFCHKYLLLNNIDVTLLSTSTDGIWWSCLYSMNPFCKEMFMLCLNRTTLPISNSCILYVPVLEKVI